MRKILIFVFSVLTVYNCSVNKKKLSKKMLENTFYYKLNINPLDNGIEFKISLSYICDSIHKVELPKDYYGTPSIDKWVTRFNGVKGTKVEGNVASRFVTPNYDNEVHLNYTIIYDPDQINKFSYAPNISSSYFYMAGCQWMLPSYPLDSISNYQIQLSTRKSGWSFYSSLSENANKINIKSSYEDLISAGFGGSSESQIKEIFYIKDNKISVYFNGYFAFDKKQFLISLKQVVSKQKDFFKDYSQPFYNITILPRDGLMAGASIPNLFYCFVDSNKDGVDIYKLISHEYFHNWLPNKFNLKTPPGQRYSKREWFSEGFTEYLSRLFLLESNIINQQQLVEMFNDDIVKIANNPLGKKSYNEILMSNGAAKKKLNYYRGPLIALKWDTELKKNGSSIKKMILSLFKESENSNGFINDSTLYEFGQKHGLNFKADVKRYIILGEEIELLHDAFKGFKLKKESINLFYPGYNVTESSKKKTIIGVDPNGPSYKAGLRNGMQYLTRKNSNIWSNGWSVDEPFVVTVKIKDEEKKISFFPNGKEHTLNLYKNND
ncbi:hypothetical protein [Psychroserpens algicola]|uniref:Peptidase M61 catalytic domain-containing protein n=1 Tax=Psychroserpens algicola TaxID=1719034 RepID=A0ABT0H6Z3_9FLAO|nr:hypothetical protein [Psychroserpens algicola]MCK8479784.1 hypothetical protein [Psychroserpens algicola]